MKIGDDKNILWRYNLVSTFTTLATRTTTIIDEVDCETPKCSISFKFHLTLTTHSSAFVPALWQQGVNDLCVRPLIFPPLKSLPMYPFFSLRSSLSYRLLAFLHRRWSTNSQFIVCWKFDNSQQYNMRSQKMREEKRNVYKITQILYAHFNSSSWTLTIEDGMNWKEIFSGLCTDVALPDSPTNERDDEARDIRTIDCVYCKIEVKYFSNSSSALLFNLFCQAVPFVCHCSFRICSSS